MNYIYTWLLTITVTEQNYIFYIYTKITEVKLSAIAYRLLHDDFSSFVRAKFRYIRILL